ncbi:MAG: helix-turn-helix domain-containing GNAT family N-acetyltransferase [Gemmatimonadota bacterium]|nr:helix-turn-helix domain-containing GNAT family N-acetyltransferase [Gemmatimonadota bacterium]
MTPTLPLSAPATRTVALVRPIAHPRPIRLRLPKLAPPPSRGAQPTDRQVDQIRAFNRFYTARAGLLDAGHLGSAFSLAQVRVLFEVAYGSGTTASDLGDRLHLSRGYLSRLLRDFTKKGLVSHARTIPDGRFKALHLTTLGRETLETLERAAKEGMRDMLAAVAPTGRAAVVDALTTVRAALRPRLMQRPLIRLRSPRPGDLGWVVERHGAIYAAEYGYDARFEGLVAQIVADFAKGQYGSRERCWVAEVDGARAGSVFVTRASARTAQLRLLLVEPWARGLKLGHRLVSVCTEFARAQHYREIILWTQAELEKARHLYEGAGYRLTASKRHAMFGKPAVAETWTLTL